MAAERIVVVDNGAVGMTAQADGLASALCGAKALHIRVSPPSFARFLPVFAAARLSRPQPPSFAPPQWAVACGGAAQAFALHLKNKHKTLAVCVQRPARGARLFDAIVAPLHDYPPNAPPPANVVLTLGAVGRFAPSFFGEPRRAAARARFAQYAPPYIAALLGGDNRAYAFDARALAKQLQDIAAAANASLLAVPSRRTPAAAVAELRRALLPKHFVWSKNGDNSYKDILAAADGFCVSADSVNMASEACAAGRAVYVLRPTLREGWRARRAARKFARFHNALYERQHARPWRDEWRWFESPPLNETARAAQEVRALLAAKRPQWFAQQ